jgi:hypothetical protein
MKPDYSDAASYPHAANDFKRLNPHIFPDDATRPLAAPLPPSLARPSKQDLKLERDLQNQIASSIGRDDVVVIHARTDKKSTIAKDLPDLMFVVKGKPVAFECKRPGEKATAAQLRMHERMRKNGWTVHVVDDYDRAMETYRKIFLKIYC